jgi:hypothetical protein
MKEIWRASANPQAWEQQPVPSLLPWWWFFWIVSAMLSNLAFQLTRGAEEISELLTANLVTQIADASNVPLSLILLSIINKIYAMQAERAATLAPSLA